MIPPSHELARTLIVDRLRAAEELRATADRPPVPRPRLTKSWRKPRI